MFLRATTRCIACALGLLFGCHADSIAPETDAQAEDIWLPPPVDDPGSPPGTSENHPCTYSSPNCPQWQFCLINTGECLNNTSPCPQGPDACYCLAPLLTQGCICGLSLGDMIEIQCSADAAAVFVSDAGASSDADTMLDANADVTIDANAAPDSAGD